MLVQVQDRVPPQSYILLNHFLQSYAFTITCTSATQVQPEVHLLVQLQVHLLLHLYIDLEVHL